MRWYKIIVFIVFKLSYLIRNIFMFFGQKTLKNAHFIQNHNVSLVENYLVILKVDHILVNVAYQ